MIRFLSRIFIKDRENCSDPDVRRQYGVLCSVVGIALNIILFAGKYFAGAVSGSIAITADAFNNLSDAGSSVITLLGFKLAGRKPDKDHPFGHGRIEYMAGLAVSAVIVVMGVDLARGSVARIISPEPASTGWLTIAILAVSICVKLYMYMYNRATAKRIGSAAMNASAIDSLSDTAATGVVLICTLIARFGGVNIDGWCGVAVSVFILYSGCAAARDTISPLLGQAPDEEFVKRIEDIVLVKENIVGMHDLIVHDYGPGRCMISLHAEVPENGNMLELHDMIDLTERELKEKLGCDAVIHMDPIATEDEFVCMRRREVSELVKELDDRLTIHDFRAVRGPNHTNLIFDVVVPQGFAMTDAGLISALEEKVRARWPECFIVVTVDRNYTGL